MINNSIQHKLTRVRPPRVKITYDVETEGAESKVELPFVIGVIGDYSGDNEEAKGMNSDFVLVDGDNMDQFMQNINPKLNYTVKKVDSEDKNISVSLDFKSRKDFEILSVIEQVEELNVMHNELCILNEMSVLIDGHEELQNTLEKILTEKNALKSLEDEVKKILIEQNK